MIWYMHPSVPIVTICFLNENFQVNFLSNFQIYDTALLTTIGYDTCVHMKPSPPLRWGMYPSTSQNIFWKPTLHSEEF